MRARVCVCMCARANEPEINPKPDGWPVYIGFAANKENIFFILHLLFVFKTDSLA